MHLKNMLQFFKTLIDLMIIHMILYILSVQQISLYFTMVLVLVSMWGYPWNLFGLGIWCFDIQLLSKGDFGGWGNPELVKAKSFDRKLMPSLSINLFLFINSTFQMMCTLDILLSLYIITIWKILSILNICISSETSILYLLLN